MENRYRRLQLLAWMILSIVMVILVALFTCDPSSLAFAQSSGYAIRFFGHGVNDIDRIKIPIDNPARPADIGATDFTLEFWMKGNDAENNPTQSVGCGQTNYSVINGNLIFDRDIWWEQGRKYAVGLNETGRLVFGVAQPGPDFRTICGTTNVLDGLWHHVAVQRRVSDGWMWIFVDGVLQTQADGPNGDISYPDGRAISYRAPYCQGPGGSWGGYCLNEPFLMIAAEKHDFDPSQYPSFSGWLDEVRLSSILQYPTNGNFTRPTAPFTTNAGTVALYHFDEGPAGLCATNQTILDSSGASGGPSNGVCKPGGSGTAGPIYTTDTPFSGALPTSTFTPTNTPTRTPTATPGPPPPPPSNPIYLPFIFRSGWLILFLVGALALGTVYMFYRRATR